MALLSARALVLHSNEKSSEEDVTSTEKIKDEELEVKEDDDDDYFAKGAPVAAQMEVLYDIKRTFTIIEKSEKSDIIPGGKEMEEDEGNETTMTKSNVWVGVFEGWLNGNPDGTSDLRWKLVFNRPAWEFPSLNNY